MSVPQAKKSAAGNPRTVEEARAFVQHVESLFMPWNVEGIVAGFTEDCVVRFGDLPEFRGRAELEKFFRARAARQKGYRHGVEVWTMRGGRIAVWEAAFNVKQAGKASSMGVLQ